MKNKFFDLVYDEVIFSAAQNGQSTVDFIEDLLHFGNIPQYLPRFDYNFYDLFVEYKNEIWQVLFKRLGTFYYPEILGFILRYKQGKFSADNLLVYNKDDYYKLLLWIAVFEVTKEIYNEILNFSFQSDEGKTQLG